MFVSWFLSFPAVVMRSLPNLDFQASVPRDDTTNGAREAWQGTRRNVGAEVREGERRPPTGVGVNARPSLQMPRQKEKKEGRTDPSTALRIKVRPPRDRSAGYSLGRVFDILARAFLGGFCLCTGIDARLLHADRFVQVHGLVIRRGRAGFDVASGFRAGHIPFQAVELDIEIVANVKRGDAIVQALKSRAGIPEAGARRQNRLQLQR